MHRFTRTIFLPGILASLVSGCVSSGIEITDLPPVIEYRCENNRVFVVERSADQRYAILHLGTQKIALTRSDSAAQEKYSNGAVSLLLQGERALVEDTGRVVAGPCQSTQPLPTFIRTH